MAHLRVFGGASLQAEAGPVTGPAAQRHRLALLSLLAVHHPRGIPRVRLMELLWPGREEGPARNLLNQAVHQIRKALGARTIRTTGGELRLDADRLTSDLLAFRDAMEADDLARAAAIHTGRFLDGFILPDAPEFERWARRERIRLEAELAGALETLAGEKSAVGQDRAAIQLWRRRAALDPFDARGVVGLVRALAGAGDRAGALREIAVHAARLRKELDTNLDPELEVLARRLRDGQDAAPEETRPGRGEHWRRGEGAVHAPPAEPRMIGRSEERERLRRAWRRAARGEAGVALVAGEAGIGKTRLAHELVAWAGKRGVVTAKARCWAAEGRLSYAPVAEWLRSERLRRSLEGIEAVWRAELAALVPELGEVGDAATASDPAAGPADGHRRRFFRALAGAVLGGGEPRLLLIDDLQWCDPDTLQWLHYLLRFAPAEPLLVLGTARTDELDGDHPLRMLITDLRRDERFPFTELALEPLSPSETAALGGAVAGRQLDASERERLFRETEGHPLFVVEGVQAGILAAEREATGSETDSLPVRVGTVIRARLAQLSSAAHAVARLAATVGREFAPEVVARASDLERWSVAEALDELIERRIVRPAGDALDFTHDKLREVVYADLNAVRRSLLHERVAEAIEAGAGGRADAVAGVLAGHWERAGDSTRAVSLYRRAARRARSVHGYEEAASYLERALGLLDRMTTPDPGERARLEMQLQQQRGDSLLRARGWAAPEVAAAHERELELAETVGDSRSVCRALWGLQSVRMVRAELAEARKLGERLLTLARDEEHALYVAAGHFVVGLAAFLMGSFGEAAEHAERGIESFQRLASGEGPALLRADVGVLLLCTASQAARFLEEDEGALRRAGEARALADRLEIPFARTAALVYSALLHQYRGEREAAEQQAVEAIALAEEFGFPHYLHTARVVRASAIAERGESDAGLAEMRAALLAYEAIGSRLRRPYFLALEAQAHAGAGYPERARERIEEAIALCDATGERWYEADLRRLRAELGRASTRDS